MRTAAGDVVRDEAARRKESGGGAPPQTLGEPIIADSHDRCRHEGDRGETGERERRLLLRTRSGNGREVRRSVDKASSAERRGSGFRRQELRGRPNIE